MLITGIVVVLLLLLAAGAVYALLRYVRKKAREDERKRLENQLRQSQRLETLGQLTGGIAHDFNNIISILLGYGEMARDDAPEGSRIQFNIQEALKAGYRARDLLQQLLTFSRGRAPERRPVEITPLVEESLRLLRASLPKIVMIQREIDPQAGFISADLSQIHQVIINLCLNAGYAMREDGGTLTVELTTEEVDTAFAARHDIQAGVHVRLAISDTGYGMTPDVQARIFEPFFTTKPAGEGTGLGLAVVHRIVKSHGGAITLSSTPGEGATFQVYLPRSEQEIATDNGQGAESTPLGKACILFVDDEEDLARMGQQMLERLGYEVEAHTDSQNAFEMFSTQPDRFDIVVTDYFMPNLTGSDLAQKMKDIRPDIPLILITGFGHVISREKAREIEFQEYLLKPMIARDLSRAIHQILSSRQGN